MSANTELYRNLKIGQQYQNAIPKYLGIKKEFDKPNNNSNVFDTLKFMAEWAKKYAYQYQNLAPLLQGKNVTNTVHNIYSFLYNHHQYNLDGEIQNLYSPSAAWHFRQKGFDCKTFSILASILLTMLKIPNAFRMVKQDGVLNGAWSHVYIIAYDKNAYHVIDATRHQNTEVIFIDKHDHNMNHIGLAYPATQSHANCGCQKLGNPLVPASGGLTPAGSTPNGFGGFTIPNLPILPQSQQQPTSSWLNNLNVGGLNVGQTINTIGSGDFGQIATLVSQTTGGFGTQSSSNTSGIVSNGNIATAYGQYLPGAINVATDIATGNYVQAGVKYLSLIKNTFKNIACIGGSAFNDKNVKEQIDLVTLWYEEKIVLINQSILSKNMNDLSFHIHEFIGAGHVAYEGMDRIKHKTKWNRCTIANIEAAKEQFRFFTTTVNKCLDLYIDMFFVRTNLGPKKIELADIFKKISWTSNVAYGSVNIPIYQLQPKQNVRIPDFKVTKFVTDNRTTPNNIVPEALLQSFVQEGAKMILDTMPKQELSANANTNPNTNTYIQPIADTQTAGIGILPMVLIGGLALGLFIKNKKTA